MRLAFLTLMLGAAITLGGCANRLSTAADAAKGEVATTAPVAQPAYVVVRTTSRPTTYPAPPPPASVRILRGTQTLPVARRTVIRPQAATARARVQPAVRAPALPTKAKPAPCVEGFLFTPQPDCVLDPCDPCAGGRCSVPR